MEAIHTGSNAESTVLALLASASATSSELHKLIKSKVRLTPKQLGALLDGLVEQRKIHGRRRKGKSGLTRTIEFTVGAPPPLAPPPRDVAPKQILSSLQAGPLSPADLKKSVKQALPELALDDFTAILGELVRAGRVYGRSKLGKSAKPTKSIELYRLGGPLAADFIPPVLLSWTEANSSALAAGVKSDAMVYALLEALRSAGFNVPIDGAATKPVDDRADVLRGVHSLEAREGRGALIPIRKLRAALRLDKARFDAAVLALYGDDAVILHHHDFVGNLTEAERNELVLDRHGNYYVGVALRGEQ